MPTHAHYQYLGGGELTRSPVNAFFPGPASLVSPLRPLWASERIRKLVRGTCLSETSLVPGLMEHRVGLVLLFLRSLGYRDTGVLDILGIMAYIYYYEKKRILKRCLDLGLEARSILTYEGCGSRFRRMIDTRPLDILPNPFPDLS